MMSNSAWQQYANDLNAMSDKEIETESEQCRNQIDEAESWLEAVAAWEAAGKPRRENAEAAQQDTPNHG